MTGEDFLGLFKASNDREYFESDHDLHPGFPIYCNYEPHWKDFSVEPSVEYLANVTFIKDVLHRYPGTSFEGRRVFSLIKDEDNLKKSYDELSRTFITGPIVWTPIYLKSELSFGINPHERKDVPAGEDVPVHSEIPSGWKTGLDEEKILRECCIRNGIPYSATQPVTAGPGRLDRMISLFSDCLSNGLHPHPIRLDTFEGSSASYYFYLTEEPGVVDWKGFIDEPDEFVEKSIKRFRKRNVFHLKQYNAVVFSGCHAFENAENFSPIISRHMPVSDTIELIDFGDNYYYYFTYDPRNVFPGYIRLF